MTKRKNKQYVIVIDTETVTGKYGLISVGAVVLECDGGRFAQVEAYFGFSDEYNSGFYYAQQKAYAKRNKVNRKPRSEIEAELADIINRYDISVAYAYNAWFDKAVAKAYLPSLQLKWLDLMQPARAVLAGAEHYPAYRRLYPDAELTYGGILKRGYSVDNVGRYLGLQPETHVAIEDVQMEIIIAERLGLFDRATEC